jgi:hypothetical protein
MHPQLGGVVPPFDQRLRDPEPSEDLERARLHSQRARLVHAVKRPVDDPDAGAARMELSGEGEPGWTGADDQDVWLRFDPGTLRRVVRERPAPRDQFATEARDRRATGPRG